MVCTTTGTPPGMWYVVHVQAVDFIRTVPAEVERNRTSRRMGPARRPAQEQAWEVGKQVTDTYE